ncbi:hypothetical protein H4582DRAFT_2108416 [Lactarius indigo]|nr:hypothetical protein H4582DRAFT_2108416 [Lactarius indigo]
MASSTKRAAAKSVSDVDGPQLTIHSVPYTGLPMHMYPFAPGVVSTSQPQIRSKRRQVKNACTNCQKACKKCDDARPCLRCVKYGIGEECKKGIKRGPYKKRDGKTPPPTMGMPLHGVPTTGGTPPGTSFMGPIGYPLPIYGQYPPIPAAHKPGYLPHHPQYYPGPYLPYGTVPYPTPYIVPHHRPDMQYPGYLPNGHHMPYSKPPSAGNAGVDVTVGVNGSTRREDHADGREGLAGIEGRST